MAYRIPNTRQRAYRHACMGLLVLDLATDAQRGRACVVAVRLSESTFEKSGATRPPNLRHANHRAVSECLDTLLSLADEPPSHVVHRVFDTASERTDVALLELLEWHVYASLAEGTAIDGVLIPDRGAARGDGALPALRVDRHDVDRIMLRASELSASLGLLLPEPPTVLVSTYGVPQTPWAQAVARAVAIWLLDPGESDPCASVPHAEVAPPNAALTRLRAVSALVAQGDLHAYPIAEAKVWFDRQGGFGGRVGSELTSRVLDHAWRGPPKPEHVHRDGAAMRRTSGIVAGILDARGGDYEAPEEILKRAFDPGPSEVGSRVDALLGRQAFAFAAAHAQRALVANHRGDSHVARLALARADEAASGESSLRATLLRVDCMTFWAIACQDAWPYVAPGEGAQGDLQAVEHALRDAVEEFRALAHAFPPRERTPRLPLPRLDLSELGSEPVARFLDPTLGQALGTLGRTQAFLGDHDAATHTLLEARAIFTTALDRGVNAAFLAHLELDRGARVSAQRLERILSSYVADDARTPAYAIARLRAEDHGFRFALDIILKALASGIELRGALTSAWHDALVSDELHALLSALCSHPTELVGRHAGEFLQRGGDHAAAQRWFALSVRVANTGGPAMQRSAVFTELLAREGTAAATGPRGCLTNPCYAQR